MRVYYSFYLLYFYVVRIIAYLSWIQERQKFEEQLKEQDIRLLIEQVENSNFSQPSVI